jgi:hypothetical protein
MRADLRICAAVLCSLSLIAPQMGWGWGSNGERLIANKAVDTLPSEMQPFFDANRDFIARHAADPLEWLEKSPATEKPNHLIMLDRYGKFPFDMLPRNYKSAVTKYGKTKIVANGVLPWQIGVYSERLTDALRSGNWEQAKLEAAWLAGYVAEAHDPFNSTENFDGKISGQPGVNQRFSSNLVDRYSLFFPLRPNDATFINDPTDHAFEDCLDSYAWLDNVLLADLRAKRGLTDYGDDYYDRFYNLAGAIVIRQLSDASTDVGSYWMTAWINAGRPSLPSR